MKRNVVTIKDIYELFREQQKAFAEEMRAFAEETRKEMREQAREQIRKEEERVKREEEQAKREEERAKREEERVKREEEERAKRKEERVKEEEERFKRERQAFREELREKEALGKKSMDALEKQLGNIGNRLGDFVEAMIAPACDRLFTAYGIEIHTVHRRTNCKARGIAMELDVIAEGDHDVVAIEVKSHLDREDITKHLRRLAQYKQAFPRHADCRVYGAVAGMVVVDEVRDQAIQQGLFVIVHAGETVVLANDPDFKPKLWGT